jgi:cytochrome c biogenesis protein CcmG, thiol:disulfide interchange protein DsbE
MTACRRRIRRLVLSLTALLLAAGCVTSTPSPARDVPAAESVPELPLTVPNVESCAQLQQRSSSNRTSEQRLQDISLPCLTDGPAVNPALLTGRPTVINLWATWCEPCREEMPILEAAYQRHGRRIAFLGVNTKDQPSWAADFLQQVNVTYPQVVDRDGLLLDSLRSPGLPVTVVLDAQGEIAGRQIGRITEQRLSELIAEATS